MKKITLTLSILFALILASCFDDATEIINESQNLSYQVSDDNTNLGTYKGVFTTLDSEFRGVIEIEINETNSSELVKSFHTATIEMQNGDIAFATSNTPVTQGQLNTSIEFSSDELSFSFSVNDDGSDPTISNVVYNNTDADVLIKKQTTKNPVITFTGIYFCNGCGGTDARTFNVILSGDGIGNQTYTTQMEFYGNAYPGIGLQENCTIDGTLSFCDAVSGDGVDNIGFSLTNGDVVWNAEMSYSTSGADCSEIAGTWFYRKGLSGEKSGTFLSDSDNCLQILTFEDFENASVNYTTSIPEFTDSGISTGKDYFIRTNGSDISSSVEFNDVVGEYYFAAQDINGEGAALPAQITFENLNISSLTTIYFSTEFAEDKAAGEKWDNPDYVHVDYSFDGGSTWTTFFSIEGDETSGTAFNSTPRVDTDFDGVGDGQVITDTFEYFRASFVNNGTTNPTASSTVSIRIEMNLDANGEDIAIDNILIRGL